MLRLDQQRLQINRFLNGVGEQNYSCLIWMADPNKLKGFSNPGKALSIRPQ